jgi:hypothetical protein
VNITRSPLTAVGAAVLALSVSVTACGSTHVSALVAGKSISPRERAASDAEANLAAVRLPAGASRVTSLPASLTGLEGQAPQVIGQIDDSQYWTVRGTAESVLSQIRAKLPHSYGLTASGSVGGLYMMPMNGPAHPTIQTSSLTIPLPVMWYDGFTLPAATGLTERSVFVSVAQSTTSQVVVRLDAQDSWPMSRTVANEIPSDVTAVTITATSPGPMIADNQVTVSSPTQVRRILALVNGMQLRATGVEFHCAVRFATLYSLVFAKGGTTVAKVNLIPSVCDVLGLQTGSAAPDLLTGAKSFITHLAAITRLPTGLGYRYSPPTQ